MYCSSHFFQASSDTSEGGDEFLYESRYRRASGMAPFFRPGNTSKGIHFHPQIYNVQFFLNRLLAAVLLKMGYITCIHVHIHVPVYTEDI